MYSGYERAFEQLGSWSFGNYFAGNVVVFGVDNISLSHTDNHKNNLLLLGEEPTDYVNGSVGSAEQKFHINFRKEKTHFF